MSTPWTVTISKLSTADGHWQLDGANFPVGKEIDVDLDSRGLREFTKYGKAITADCVEMVSDREPKILVPVELIEGI